MSHNLSQPEEVDLVLRDSAENDTQADVPVADKNNYNGRTQAQWHGDYVSPYRAAHMKLIRGLSDP